MCVIMFKFGDMYIGKKIVDYYYNIVGRKFGYITTMEKNKARKKNKKKRKK